MLYKTCFGLFVSIIILPFVLTNTCTTVPVKVDTSALGESITYCEYRESNRSKPVQLLPGAEIATTDCKTCTCSTIGLQCCEKPKPPTDIPPFCKIVEKRCKFQIVLTNDPSVDCFTGQSVINEEHNPLKAMLLKPETTALIGLVKKAAALISSWWSSRNRNPRNRGSQAFMDADGEPTFMDMFMYMNGNNQADPINRLVGGNSISNMFSVGTGSVASSLLSDILTTSAGNGNRKTTAQTL